MPLTEMPTDVEPEKFVADYFERLRPDPDKNGTAVTLPIRRLRCRWINSAIHITAKILRVVEAVSTPAAIVEVAVRAQARGLGIGSRRHGGIVARRKLVWYLSLRLRLRSLTGDCAAPSAEYGISIN